jgi:hypothetical protein
MILTDGIVLARLIHQERIQAAQAPRPEWTFAARQEPRPNLIRQLRGRVSQALRHLAARVHVPAEEATRA